MEKIKKKLDIDNAIILSNAERLIQKKPTIKDKKHLAVIIANRLEQNLPFATEKEVRNLYMKLYRSEKDGFFNLDKNLLDLVLSELQIPENKILVDF